MKRVYFTEPRSLHKKVNTPVLKHKMRCSKGFYSFLFKNSEGVIPVITLK